MIPVAQPVFGQAEEEAVLHVLHSGQLAQGSQVAAFEQQFAQMCGVSDAVAVSSGTAALHLALLAHEIGPGDEVITTPFSFVATANAILMVGATPVFVDIEPQTYTLDWAKVEAAITPRTKAILPVHLYGHPCVMDKLMALAEEHKVAVIEDACQAHAAQIRGKVVGSFGTGCFSFYATKNMSTGEGGMVTTNKREIAERVRLLRSHGQQVRYVHHMLGYNLRMTEIQGALGVMQLSRLETFTQQRIDNAAYLTRQLSDVITTPIVREGYRHVYHQYTVRVQQGRDRWVQQLQERGIGCAIHYPVPIHLQPFYREHKENWRSGSSLAQAERAAQEVLSLPVHPALKQEELEAIVKEVRGVCS